MISSTVLRVKRRLDEAPHEALLVHCKRLKTDNKDSNNKLVEPSLFVFSGTVANKENSPDFKRIRSTVKNESKIFNDISLIVEKLRDERIKQSQTNRFEILNYNRGITTNPAEYLDKDHSVLDIEQKNINLENKDETCGYTYDLYLASKESNNDIILEEADSVIRIDSLNAELMYNVTNQGNQDLESSDDSEDSNDENNYRNDYPDTPDGSIGEDDMIAAMESVEIGNDLSSDDGEESLIYNDKLTLNEIKPNKDDIDRYGPAYANYKARVIAGENVLTNSSNFVHIDSRNEDTKHGSGYKNSESDDEFYYAKDDDLDCEGSPREKHDSYSSNDSD